MEDDGVLRLTGIITDYTIWDDTINLYAEKFHTQFNVYPNILLASDFTYQKIDLYAQMHPDRLIEHDGAETLETSGEPYEGISYFTTEDYELECCLDYDLPGGSFTLVFDEAPDFDGSRWRRGRSRRGCMCLGGVLEGEGYFTKDCCIQKPDK